MQGGQAGAAAHRRVSCCHGWPRRAELGGQPWGVGGPAASRLLPASHAAKKGKRLWTVDLMKTQSKMAKRAML